MGYKEQLLIIEDDITLNRGLCKALKSADYQVISCDNIKDAKEQLLLGTVSLVILDINLPDGNGLDLLREIKDVTPNLPVILLTANDTDSDIVNGLNQGADDYITKPFSLAVLKARVATQLRKAEPDKSEDIYTDNEYSFDFDNMRFKAGEALVELSKTELKTLRILVMNANHTVSRDTIIDYVWTDGLEYVDENALSVTIKRLRDKLSLKDRIKTVYGIGYSWVSDNG